MRLLQLTDEQLQRELAELRRSIARKEPEVLKGEGQPGKGCRAHHAEHRGAWELPERLLACSFLK